MKEKKLATALKFDPKVDAVPQVVAKGVGIVAENIIERAKEENIPVYQDEKLARNLSHLETGDVIPEDMYEVVAEVLLFIAYLDNN